MSIADNIIGRIAPRPPGREVNNRFWIWLQEQIEKIRDSLNGCIVTAFQDSTATGIPATPGPHTVAETEIPEGVFSSIEFFAVRVESFGFFANTANTKDIVVAANGTTIASYSGTAQNQPFRLAVDLVARGGSLVCSGEILINGVAPILKYTLLAFDKETDALTIEMTADSSADALDDVRVDNFTLSTAKVQT